MADIADQTAIMATSELHLEDRDLIERLAKLQDIHDQIHELRNLLPGKLMKPTRLALERPNSTSPQQLASSLSSAATSGSREILKFKKDFRNEEMQDLWSKTNSSDFPQGRDTWCRDYVALAKTYDVNDTDTSIAINGNFNGTASPHTSPQQAEDVEAVVKAFKESNPTVKVITASPNASSPFPLAMTFNNITYLVTWDKDDHSEACRYNVEIDSAKTKSGMASEILKHFKTDEANSLVNNEKSQVLINTSLATLLSKLASYQGWQFKACEACHSIFDDDLQYALVRKRKKKTAASPATAVDVKDDKDNQDKVQTFPEWNVYHDGCTP